MLSIFLLIPLSLMLFVVAIWAVRYAVRSNQFEDLDNASQRIILDDRQERRQTMQMHTTAPDEAIDLSTQQSTLQDNTSQSQKADTDNSIDIDTGTDTSTDTDTDNG